MRGNGKKSNHVMKKKYIYLCVSPMFRMVKETRAGDVLNKMTFCFVLSACPPACLPERPHHGGAEERDVFSVLAGCDDVIELLFVPVLKQTVCFIDNKPLHVPQ